MYVYLIILVSWRGSLFFPFFLWRFHSGLYFNIFFYYSCPLGRGLSYFICKIVVVPLVGGSSPDWAI